MKQINTTTWTTRTRGTWLLSGTISLTFTEPRFDLSSAGPGGIPTVYQQTRARVKAAA